MFSLNKLSSIWFFFTHFYIYLLCSIGVSFIAFCLVFVFLFWIGYSKAEFTSVTSDDADADLFLHTLDSNGNWVPCDESSLNANDYLYQDDLFGKMEFHFNHTTNKWSVHYEKPSESVSEVILPEGIFLKVKKNYSRFFIFNLIFMFFFIMQYVNFFYYNIFNYLTILFDKKVKFLYFNLDWVISLDYINFYFIILTNFIFFIIYLTVSNLKFKNDLTKNHNSLLLFTLLFLIEISLLLTFSTSNMFFFFFFFECSLIPMYFLIQLWGKGLKKKQYASLSLVFFTLTGSIFLLAGILYIVVLTGCCDFKHLNYELLDFNSQLFLFILFFLGFSVKVPIFPFYSWLPEAHVEASTSVSILLAAIFLKIATYGLLKIVIFNFFLVNIYCYSLIFYFSLFSIIIATFLVLVQTDLKKIIALSSIIHMNYMVIALFTLDPKAILGSFIYMFSHALISSALFYLVGILYENTGTRDILNFASNYNYNSKFFFFFFFFNIANISFPLTVSFISELIILNNMIYFSIFALIIVIISIFFSTIYTFWMIHNVSFGNTTKKKNFFHFTKFDTNFLLILFAFVLLLGIIPSIVLFNLEQELYLILINKLNIF